MVTSYIWLVLFIGLILLFTNRHLITSRQPPLKANGPSLLEAIQHTYEIEEIELKKSVEHQDDHNYTLIIKLIYTSSLPASDILADTAAHIVGQVKEVLAHPKEYKSCKLYFINKHGGFRHNPTHIALFEYTLH